MRGSDPLDPCDPDTNNSDCEEVLKDTDGDTFTDREEADMGADPLDPCDPSPTAPAAIKTTTDSPMRKKRP